MGHWGKKEHCGRKTQHVLRLDGMSRSSVCKGQQGAWCDSSKVREGEIGRRCGQIHKRRLNYGGFNFYFK